MRAAPLNQAVRVASTLVFLAYPVAIYAGLTWWGVRGASLLMLALLLPLLSLRIGASVRGGLRRLGLLPVVTGLLLALSAALDTSRFLLAVPGVMNFLLLASFGATLIWGPPMIERFARLVHADLTDPEVGWCRVWTAIWCGFFALNGATAVGLAVWAPLQWWTVYNGLVAYLLIGCLFAIEWVLRKMRFRRVGQAWPERFVDRFLLGSPRAQAAPQSGSPPTRAAPQSGSRRRS